MSRPDRSRRSSLPHPGSDVPRMWIVGTASGSERRVRPCRPLRALRGAALTVVVAVALLPAADAGAVELNPGDILVTDVDLFGASDAVIRVDPSTGAQTTVSTGGFF